MNIFCVTLFTILISTVSSKSTPTSEYNDDYYDDIDDNNTIQNDKSVSEDSTLRPSFVTKPQTIYAKEGDQVRLDCLTKNAGVVMWKKDDQPVTTLGKSINTDVYDYIESNNTLILKYIKPISNGYYSCIILISTNDNITLTHRVKVENTAEVTSILAENNRTKLTAGDKLVISCKAKGLPKPLIKWYFKGQDEEQAVALETNNALRTADSETVVIPNVNMKNSGDYRCEANNGQSTDYQTIHIDVFDKGRIGSETHSDSMVGGGSEHLLPSIALLVTTLVLINQ